MQQVHQYSTVAPYASNTHPAVDHEWLNIMKPAVQRVPRSERERTTSVAVTGPRHLSHPSTNVCLHPASLPSSPFPTPSAPEAQRMAYIFISGLAAAVAAAASAAPSSG